MSKLRRSDLLTILAVAAVLGMAFLGVTDSASTADAYPYPPPTVPAGGVDLPLVRNAPGPPTPTPIPGPGTILQLVHSLAHSANIDEWGNAESCSCWVNVTNNTDMVVNQPQVYITSQGADGTLYDHQSGVVGAPPGNILSPGQSGSGLTGWPYEQGCNAVSSRAEAYVVGLPTPTPIPSPTPLPIPGDVVRLNMSVSGYFWQDGSAWGSVTIRNQYDQPVEDVTLWTICYSRPPKVYRRIGRLEPGEETAPIGWMDNCGSMWGTGPHPEATGVLLDVTPTPTPLPQPGDTVDLVVGYETVQREGDTITFNVIIRNRHSLPAEDIKLWYHCPASPDAVVHADSYPVS